MSTVELRLAGVAEEPVLLELARAFHAEDGHPLTEQGAAAIGQITRGHPLGRAWLIVESDEVLGYVVLCLGFGIEYGGADAFVDDLYLVPKARGRGLGRAVLQLVEIEASMYFVPERMDGAWNPLDRGGRDQDEALAFYRDKLGFTVRTDMRMDNGFRWLSVSPPAQPDLELVLYRLEPSPTMNADAVAQVRSLIERRAARTTTNNKSTGKGGQP